MNPILLFYIFLGGFILWVLSSWLFKGIGEYIEFFLDYIKKLMEKDDEE